MEVALIRPVLAKVEVSLWVLEGVRIVAPKIDPSIALLVVVV